MKIMRVVEFEGDKDAYRKQLNTFYNFLCAGGNGIFKALEPENGFIQGLKFASTTAYYAVNPKAGQIQYKYWLYTNRTDYSKMIAFFNIQSNSK